MDAPEGPRLTDGSAALTAARPRAIAARFGAVYATLFFFVGVHLPYFPEWLATRGLSPTLRGALLGVSPWARVIVAPWLGRLADRRRDARPLFGMAIALGLFAVAVMWAASSPLEIAIGAVLFGIANAPLVSLLDGLGVRFATARELVYGRVRSLGSVGFIVANLLGGAAWSTGDDRVIGTMLVCFALLAAFSFALPEPPARIAGAGTGSGGRSLRRPAVVLFFVAGAIVQLSHATVYSFGTTTFERAGAPPSSIGALWTTGVFAEIALFLASRRVFARIAPTTLQTIAAASSVVRWWLLATATTLPSLFVAQTLHGLSFGAQHLATIAFIEREVDEPGAATGIAVALGSGVAFGVGMPLAGVLFDAWDRGAYFASVVFAAIATGVSIFATRALRAQTRQGAGT